MDELEVKFGEIRSILNKLDDESSKALVALEAEQYKNSELQKQLDKSNNRYDALSKESEKILEAIGKIKEVK